jgi:hypothetical protein
MGIEMVRITAGKIPAIPCCYCPMRNNKISFSKIRLLSRNKTISNKISQVNIRFNHSLIQIIITTTSSEATC